MADVPIPEGLFLHRCRNWRSPSPPGTLSFQKRGIPMKWSWKIFTAFGIGVYVHATFLLLLLFFFLGPVLRPEPGSASGIPQGFASMLLIILVFASVLLHEFGHALTARRYGVRTRDITLLPIGGLARLERIPSDPRQELAISVAGPAVNLGIAAVLFALGNVLGWGPEVLPQGGMVLSGRSFLRELLAINIGLAIFNFIPAFPMDGGRILRALLALKLDYVRATGIAVSVGQALAFAFGLWGLLNMQYMLVLIAFFIYLGAGQEGAAVQYRRSFEGLPASCAMMTDFHTLHETDRLERAVEYLLHGSQIDFPVLRDGRVLGVLTRSGLIDALGKLGPHATIDTVPLREVEVAGDDMPLDLAFERLQSQGLGCMPITRGDRLVGLITMENLTEFAMVHSAIRLKLSRGGEARAA